MGDGYTGLRFESTTTTIVVAVELLSGNACMACGNDELRKAQDAGGSDLQTFARVAIGRECEGFRVPRKMLVRVKDITRDAP
mmetsp:Transcript_28985/g.46827  ORF Transcript_28985/g.46827 Transcript_28985/m.46827 type:complete len:82 (-) Transcript_28985:132-377(-)